MPLLVRKYHHTRRSLSYAMANLRDVNARSGDFLRAKLSACAFAGKNASSTVAARSRFVARAAAEVAEDLRHFGQVSKNALQIKKP